MFGKKKQPANRKSPKGGGEALLKQMGLQDIEADLYGDIENDDELEAELAALQAETFTSPKTQKPGSKGPVGIDCMVASCLRDDDSADSDGDLDDPTLLAELNDLASHASPSPAVSPDTTPAPPQATLATLEQRLSLYREAHQTAINSNETSKLRRLQRGIKTLEGLVKHKKAGKSVSEDDVPPVISVTSKTSLNDVSPRTESRDRVSPWTESRDQVSPRTESCDRVSPVGPTPTLPANGATAVIADSAPHHTSGATPKQPTHAMGVKRSVSPNKTRAMLLARQDEYKSAAMQAKTAGDLRTATKYLAVSKQFQKVIQAMDEDKPVDLSAIPGPPTRATVNPPARVTETVNKPIPSPRVVTDTAQTRASDEMIDNLPETTDEDKKRLYSAPPKPVTVMDALEQRLEKYKATADAAKAAADSSKQRRMARVAKLYEKAIKDVKAGLPVDYDGLPVPPGFPPIPQLPTTSPPSVAHPLTPTKSPVPVVHPQTATKSPVPVARPTQSTATTSPQAVPPPSAKKTTPSRPDNRRQSGSRAQQQASFLRERQSNFKQAALKAKQNGDMELAKKYLRQTKGFNQMIDAAESGLPVDLSQVPSLSDSADLEGFVLVSNEECDADSSEMYTRLQEELMQQIKTATNNAEHFTQLGDVSSASKFDKMCLATRKDLDAVRNSMKHGDPVPRFHYETRHFSLVQCCTELGDNDLEITVVRGINYSTPQGYSPDDLQTFVKFDFPFPNDAPQKGTSDVCKCSNPEYKQTFKLQINRKSRAFMRVVKLKAVKLEVYYKRGFFKGDKVLGSVTVKLQPLENACVLHDSYNLCEGKKAVGGMLEVKVRVRDPFLGKQVEEVREKWLLIDSFDTSGTNVGKNNNAATATTVAPQQVSAPVTAQPAYTSMEVLKYEKQLLDQRVQKLKGKLTKSEELTMQQKSKLLAKQVEDTRNELRDGGVAVIKVYLETIEKTKAVYQEEAQAMLSQDNREKAQILLTKRKLVEREIAAMQQKRSK